MNSEQLRMKGDACISDVTNISGEWRIYGATFICMEAREAVNRGSKRQELTPAVNLELKSFVLFLSFHK
jgi:hypothetical protein